MAQGLEGLPPAIGRYQLTRLLGRGGMGRVVAGFDPALRREVAIKIVEPTSVAPGDLEEMRFLFHREARATAALRHPNIIEVYDYSGPEAQLPYIAVELVEGPTLAEVLRQRGGLPMRITAAVGYELAQALGEAHRVGIVHRDLKPENVFWTDSGRVILSDFGIAKAFDRADRLGSTLQFGGTSLYGSPSYMAPEQLEEGSVGPHTDLHALGAVLYECASGVHAFRGDDMHAILEAVIEGRHQPLEELVAAPAAFVRLVESMLSTDAGVRPASAAVIAGELRRVLDGLDVSDPRLVLRGVDDATVVELPAAPGRDPHGRDDDGDDVGPLRVKASPSAWSSATRGPLVLGAVALVVIVVSGFFLLQRVRSEPAAAAAPLVPPDPTVSTAAGAPPTDADSRDVLVKLRFPGTQTLFVDGAEVGTWTDSVRLALPPGRHTLETRSGAAIVRRDVLLIPATTPEFDLSPPP